MQLVTIDGIDPTSVMLAVGAQTYGRGVAYARQRAVLHMEWDDVDSLLQANRAKNVAEFHGARLGWSGGECETGTRSLPISLCADLDTRLKVGELDLGSKLVFYHFGFDDVRNADLKRQLDAIPTSFSIDEDHVKLINQAVAEVIEPTNPCLQQMRNILKGDAVPAPLARKVCHNVDILPKPPAKQ